MAFDDHFYLSADGRLDLYARVYPGSGPALLLMHGLTRNSADFEPLVEALEGDYLIVSADQRGRGRSGYDPDIQNYRPHIYVADMLKLLDGLGIAEVIAIGTSMGGLMAMIMGAMHKDRIRAIIINDVGPEVSPVGVARIQTYVGKTGLVASWKRAAAACRDINGIAFPNFDHADWIDFAKRTYIEEQGMLKPAYDPAIANGLEGEQPAAVPPDLWSMWDMLDELPILLVRGGISDILSVNIAARMEKWHRGFFQRVDVANVGHAPILNEPEASSAIRDFLRRFAS